MFVLPVCVSLSMIHTTIVMVAMALGIVSLALPTNIDELVPVFNQLIVSAGRSSDPGFWRSTIDNVVEQCCPKYMERLAQNFNDIKGSGDPEMVKMYDLLKRTIMRYCDEKFSLLSEEILKLCPTSSDCDRTIGGYRLGMDWGPRWDFILAFDVARIMKQTVGAAINSTEEFRRVYSQRGPCKVIFDRLDQPDMREYTRYFLRLLLKSKFHDAIINMQPT